LAWSRQCTYRDQIEVEPTSVFRTTTLPSFVQIGRHLGKWRQESQFSGQNGARPCQWLALPSKVSDLTAMHTHWQKSPVSAVEEAILPIDFFLVSHQLGCTVAPNSADNDL